MSVSKTNILDFVEWLSLDLEDDTSASNFFDDVIERLAFLEKPLFFKHDIENFSAGTSVYDFAADMLDLHWASLADSFLLPCSEDDLNAYASSWRADTGTPEAISSDRLTRQYRVYPTPSSIMAYQFMYIQDRSTGILEIYQIPIALKVLAQDFVYDSKHQDLDFSGICDQIGSLFLNLLGH